MPRPTARTLGFAALGGALFVLAWVSGQEDVVWPALFGMAVPLFGLLVAHLARPGFRVMRTLSPEVAAVGEAVRVDVTVVANRPGFGASAIARDDPGDTLGAAHTFRLDTGGAGATTASSYTVRPRRRGRYTLDGLEYRTGDTLGFWMFGRRIPHPSALVVTPRLYPLPGAQLPAYGEVGETPLPRTSLFGPDDATVREYHSGDDVRRIHWRSTARAGELMVRREEAAWDPSAWILLDSRAAVHPEVDGERPGFEWLVSAAASIGLRLLDDGFDVGLVDAEGRAHEASGQIPGSPLGWLDPLVDVTVTPADDLLEATAQLTRRPADPVVIALLGRLDRGTADLLSGLSGSRHARVALALTPHDDDRPAFDDARRRLGDHGWDIRETAPGTDLAAAWLGTSAGAAR